ncbi:orotidine-5'-phosphate decarboxylase [Glaciecola siphonariae]|uniref:Orotidine 5'-phosphate decarboxylase n=1 Tax=Glaciecola siphonariae TaxID=521012 RepID=A0ABV9LTK0_9ALTE
MSQSSNLSSLSYAKSPVVIALDFDDIDRAKSLVNQLSPEQCRLKVGKEMFTLFGPDWVRYLVERDFDVFLDLKFHDIPNTVAKAVSAAAKLGVWMTNVHACGGQDMIQAAKEAAHSSQSQAGVSPPILTAVTVLTSMDERQFSAIYQSNDIAAKVLELALLAQNSGADGVVCSAKEAVMLRERVNKNFCLVTPGIRPAGSALDDQKRVMTPNQAIQAGVDYLVIGRPITNAPSPVEALAQINASLT